MEQKTIQISIEDDNGIQSFVVWQVRYKDKGEDVWHSWITYFDRENARNAVEILEGLPEVKFACIDRVNVFI